MGCGSSTSNTTAQRREDPRAVPHSEDLSADLPPSPQTTTSPQLHVPEETFSDVRTTPSMVAESYTESLTAAPNSNSLIVGSSLTVNSCSSGDGGLHMPTQNTGASTPSVMSQFLFKGRITCWIDNTPAYRENRDNRSSSNGSQPDPIIKPKEEMTAAEFLRMDREMQTNPMYRSSILNGAGPLGTRRLRRPVRPVNLQ